MRIVCPSCTAAYEVPDSLLTPGRTVRCAKCGESWVALQAAPVDWTDAPEEPPAQQPLPDDEAPTPPRQLTAMERLAQAPAVPPRPSIALRAAWAASFGAMALLVWGAYAWRSDVMRHWPPSIRAYDALGLAEPMPKVGGK